MMGWRLFLCLPALLGLLAMGQGPVGVFAGGITIACAALVLIGRVGRWPALVALWLGWLVGALILAVGAGAWPVAVFTIGLAWVASFAAVKIGRAWGEARAVRMRARGRGIRESEWVFTGPDYVQGHPLNRLGFGLWATVVVLGLGAAIHALWVALSVAALTEYGGPIGVLALWQAALAVVYIAPVWPILKRRPVAYPLLLLAFAVSVIVLDAVMIVLLLPVLIYWSDGVRPNLIYRYRFQRLVPEEASHV